MRMALLVYRRSRRPQSIDTSMVNLITVGALD